MRRPRIGAQDDVRRRENRNQFLERGLPDEVDRLALRRCDNPGRIAALDFCSTASQDDLGSETVARIVGYGCIVFDAPIAIVAKALSGARADDQAGPVMCDDFRGTLVRRGAERNVPDRRVIVDAERGSELE